MTAYLEFAKEFKEVVEPYPCSSTQACMYLAFLARRLSFSSIKNYLSALSIHLKDMGFPPVDYDNHQLKKCMMGIKRVKGDYVKKATPLLPNGLLKIMASLSIAPAHTAVRAAMLLSFRTLLRKSHVTDGDSCLKRANFKFMPWGMMVSVEKSKTNQFRERVHMIPVTRVVDTRLCAVYWVDKHFRECPAPQQYKAFRMPRAGNSVPLTYTYYQEALKAASARSGMDPSKVSTHSLRRGGANYLRSVGVSIMEIKERGDWRSDCVYEYLETSVNERLATDLRVSNILSYNAD